MLDIIERNQILPENVVRHRDVSTTGKVDIDDSFWLPHKTWQGYISFLFFMSKYTEIMNKELAEAGMDAIFSSYDGQAPLTEKETKELITIALCRFLKKILQKK